MCRQDYIHYECSMSVSWAHTKLSLSMFWMLDTLCISLVSLPSSCDKLEVSSVSLPCMAFAMHSWKFFWNLQIYLYTGPQQYTHGWLSCGELSKWFLNATTVRPMFTLHCWQYAVKVSSLVSLELLWFCVCFDLSKKRGWTASTVTLPCCTVSAHLTFCLSMS
jgi:hypothetical protein